MKIYMLIIMFIMIGALFIISENNLALRKTENVSKFTGLYFNWAGQVLQNFKHVSGYIIRLDWLPDKNQTVPSSG